MSKTDFVSQMYEAGLQAGLTDAAARVMASQAAIESNYGKKAPGNNYFGIKAGKSWDGPTQLLTTHEGSGENRVKVKSKFRVYDTPEAGIADRIKFMDRAFPSFSQAQTVGDALDALRNGRFGKYYTDSKSKYEGAVNSINTNYLGGTPVPPEGIPAGQTAVGSELSTNPAGTYRVKSGDTLGKIAARLGTTAEALATANGISDPNKIRAGQSLKIGSDTSQVSLPRPRPNTEFNLNPPNLPLNAPIPTGGGRSWGPLTPNWGPGFNTGRAAAPTVQPGMMGRVSPPSQAQPNMMGRGLPTIPAAPTPFPAPRGTEPPTIAPLAPAAVATARAASTQPATQQVRLASGKTIATGVYPSNDGNHSVKVADDGRGNAVVTRIPNIGEIPGVIDPLRTMKTDTLAGGVIRKIAPAIVGQAVQSGKDAMGSAGSFLGTEAQKAGDFVSRAANNFPPYRAASQAISGIPDAIQSAVMSNYVMPGVRAQATDAATAAANEARGAAGALGNSTIGGIGQSLASNLAGKFNFAAGALGFGGHPTPPPALNPWAPMAAAGPMGTTYSPYAPYMPTGGPGTFAPGSMPRAVVAPRQVVAPVPQRRPFFGISSPPPVVQQRVAVSAPQQQQGYSGQTYARAQQDLRDSGMVNSFGMVV